jgi:hypothetical protein
LEIAEALRAFAGMSHVTAGLKRETCGRNRTLGQETGHNRSFE